MQDLIERQAAIDTLADMHCKSDEDGYVWIIRSDAWARIDALPSAQPEIIQCRECKHGKWDIFDRGMWCELHPSLDVDENDFCSMAERRTDD